MPEGELDLTMASRMGRDFRKLAFGLGIGYLLIPTARFGLALLPIPGGALDLLVSDFVSALNGLHMPVGLLALACLGVSLWRARDRDWPAVDRAFGTLLGIATGIMAITLVTLWTPPAAFYTENTQRIVYVLAFLGVALPLSATVLFFVRAPWAALPLAFLVLMRLVLYIAPIEPDHPGFLAEHGEAMRKALFFQAVDDSFWTAYWDTRDPEDVSALFAGLDPEARSALSGVIGVEAVDTLLENGHDSIFLQTFVSHQRRDETGAFVSPITVMSTSVSVVRSDRTLELFCVALAYALARTFMVARSRTTS